MDLVNRGTKRLTQILSHLQKNNVSNKPSINGGRLVRFKEQNSDDILFGLLNENDEAVLGTSVEVLNGNIFEPKTYKKSGVIKKIGKL